MKTVYKNSDLIYSLVYFKNFLILYKYNYYIFFYFFLIYIRTKKNRLKYFKKWLWENYFHKISIILTINMQ